MLIQPTIYSMKKPKTNNKIIFISMISLIIAISLPSQAGFDPVPKKVSRHQVSHPDFGKPNTTPEPVQEQEKADKPDLAKELANKVVAPVEVSSKLVNTPEFESKTIEYTFKPENIGSWQKIDFDGRSARVAPVIIADSGWELNLHEVTAQYEGDGSIDIAMVYYYNNDIQSAIDKKHYAGYRKADSGQTIHFSDNHRGQGHAWILLAAKGKVKLTGLKYSANAIKSGLYGHIPREYRFAHGNLQYRILYPKNYDPQKKYPMVIGVHGSGGVGSDNRKSMEMTNLARFIYVSHYNDPQFECFSIVPQIPDDKSIPAPYYPKGNIGVYNTTFHPVRNLSAVNAPGWYTQATLSLIHEMIESTEYSIDENRIYYTGFSYGGKGCWEFLKAEPDLFAGAICCAGWPIGMPYQAPTPAQMPQLRKEIARYKQVPVYITAGENDNMKIPSKIQHEEIQAQGGTSFYKEFKGASHVNSAIKTWTDKEIIKWLFDQRKESK